MTEETKTTDLDDLIDYWRLFASLTKPDMAELNELVSKTLKQLETLRELKRTWGIQ